MKKEIYLAGGCFWGTQKFFDQFYGVLETEVGYANGSTENPSYQEVCAGSGHAETLRIIYDNEVISLSKLLEPEWPGESRTRACGGLGEAAQL